MTDDKLEKARTLREQIQKASQEAVRKMAERDVQAAYENYSSAIKNYRSTGDKVEKEHGFRASRDVLTAMGILPANTQSISIQNITNKQTNIISPVVMEMIQKHLRLKPPEEVEDAIQIEEG